jgi:uncharacterized protein YutE (UPF0331/DUF86 family)
VTPSTIDLKVTTGRLEIAAACLRGLRALPAGSLASFLADPRNPAAAESYLRRALEALLDLSRYLLAKAYGESVVEYRQVALRAVERGIVKGSEAAELFPKLAGYRNRLTHFYADVTPEELFQILTLHLGDLDLIAEELRVAAGRLAAHPAPVPPG